MHFLHSATGSLLSSLQAAGGEIIAYHFGDYCIGLTAVKAETMNEVETFSGQFEHLKVTDWIVRADDLVIAGEAMAPEEGNIIEYGKDLYEVLPVGNQKAWEYVDPYKIMLRVHSQLKETYHE